MFQFEYSQKSQYNAIWGFELSLRSSWTIVYFELHEEPLN